MNVNRNLRFCGFFALALLAVSFVPTSASAQVYRGQFTLNFPARWGGLDLPAGEYSFTVSNLTSAGLITIERGRKVLGYLFMTGISYCKPAGESALIAVRVGGAYRINVLRLEKQCVISFDIPKNERLEMAARMHGPDLARLVTIPATKA